MDRRAARQSGDAADAAVAKFEEGARHIGLSAKSRVLNATVGEGPELFGKIARRFDLNRSAERSGKAGKSGLAIEAALFDAGRPVLIGPTSRRRVSVSIMC